MKKAYFSSVQARADWIAKKQDKLVAAKAIKASGDKTGLWGDETIDISIMRIEAQITNAIFNSTIVAPAGGRCGVGERRKAQKELEKKERDEAKRKNQPIRNTLFYSKQAQSEVRRGLQERIDCGAPLGFKAFQAAMKLLTLWI